MLHAFYVRPSAQSDWPGSLVLKVEAKPMWHCPQGILKKNANAVLSWRQSHNPNHKNTP